MGEAAATDKPASPVFKALLGQKLGMTQIFDPQGQAIPVTVVQAGPCQVMRVLTKEKDRYAAVQMAFGDIRGKSVNKPDAGRFKKTGLPPARWVREFRTDSPVDLRPGQTLGAPVFAPGDYVDVCGISKGKGFAGTVKRHHFGGGPSTHGQSDRQRAPGSIGSNTFPGHVFKGMRMAGHLGSRRATVQHLEVVQVLPAENLLLVKGALPGAPKSLVVIRQTVKSVTVNARPVAPEAAKKQKPPKKEAPKAAPAAKPKADKA